MSYIDKIKEQKEYLLSMRDFTEKEKEKLRIEYIINNTKIIDGRDSGFTNEEKETCLIDGWDESRVLDLNKDTYFYYDIIGIQRSYNYIQSVLKDEKTSPYVWNLSDEELQWLNRIILDKFLYLSPQEKGFYRSFGFTYIDCKRLPNIEEFTKMLKELMMWYGKTDMDLISKLAYFHLKFEDDIHPFHDGNGRTGRAVMNLELARNGYPLIGLKNNNIEQYQFCFNEYRRNGDTSNMRDLIIQELEKEMTKQITMKKTI